MDFRKINNGQVLRFMMAIFFTFYGVSANCQSEPPTLPAYSDFVKSNGFLFVSGQIASPEIGTPDLSFSDEAESVLKKIVQILRINNLITSDVVSCTVYLSDIKHFSEFNTIYRKYFKTPYPSRTCVGGVQMIKQARIEISLTASLK